MFDWFDSKQENTVHDAQAVVIIIFVLLVILCALIYIYNKYQHQKVRNHVRESVMNMNRLA